jgi:ATP-dependent Clp protease ATP-binding subunit ClpA
MRLGKFKSTAMFVSPRLGKPFKLSRVEAERTRRCRNSLDLLVGILTQKKYPVSQRLQRLGITAEIARASFDPTLSEPNPIAGKSLLTRLLAGQLCSGPTSLSEDFQQALFFAFQRCAMRERLVVSVDDIMWGIFEANHKVLYPLLESVGLNAKTVQQSVEE